MPDYENIEVKKDEIVEDVEESAEGAGSDETVETVEETAEAENVENTAAEDATEPEAQEPSFEERVVEEINAIKTELESVRGFLAELKEEHAKRREAAKGFFAPIPKDRESEVKGRVTAEDVRTFTKKYV